MDEALTTFDVDFPPEALKFILLDLYRIDNGMMGRCRVEIYDENEKFDETDYVKHGPKKLNNYTRILYWQHGWTSVCVYQKEKSNDKN